MAIGVAEEQPRLVPVTLAAAGLAALAAGVAVGGTFALAGPVSFLALLGGGAARGAAEGAALVERDRFLAGGHLADPIKLYTLPVKISFQLDPYRLIVLVLLVAFVLQWIVENKTPTRLRHKGPLIAMALAAVASLAVNVSALHSNALQQQVVKSLGDYLAYLVLFVLIATKIRAREALDRTVLVIVCGGTLVALAAIYESRTHHNLFTHLNTYVPILKPVARGRRVDPRRPAAGARLGPAPDRAGLRPHDGRPAARCTSPGRPGRRSGESSGSWPRSRWSPARPPPCPAPGSRC